MLIQDFPRFRKKTLIAIALLFWPLATLLSAEKDSPTFLISGELSGGSETVNYNPINYELMRSGNRIRGIKENYLGITGILIYHRVIINTSSRLSYDNQEEILDSKVYSFGLSNAVKIGVSLFPDRQDILFPYMGVGLESLLIKTDLKFGTKGFNFFRDKNDYLIYNVAFLYGLAYDWPILVREKNWPLPLDVFMGVDAGGMISKSHHRWIINGKNLETYGSRDRAPEFDLSDFMVGVHFNIGLYKR